MKYSKYQSTAGRKTLPWHQNETINRIKPLTQAIGKAIIGGTVLVLALVTYLVLKLIQVSGVLSYQ
jgi:hypothetical protein